MGEEKKNCPYKASGQLGRAQLGHLCSALQAHKPSEEGLASGRCRHRAQGLGDAGSERRLISSQGQPGLGGHPAPPPAILQAAVQSHRALRLSGAFIVLEAFFSS